MIVALLLAMVTSLHEHDAALLAAARQHSAVFTDLVFGYQSERFHREWHAAWNAPDARVVQWSPVEHGKTQHATGWGIHCLGNDPVNTRLLWVGSALGPAKKSVGVIKTLIEDPPDEVRAVFPRLRPGPRWTDTQFTVRGAKVTEKDYSVEAVGVEGAVLGGRYTHIILDDICTFQTTYTAARRAAITRWVISTIIGRLLPGGRLICLGNAWYPDDVMHALAQRGFKVIRQEAYRESEEGRIVPKSILWPAQWSVDRLNQRRKELGTVEALRQLRCKPYSAGQGRFRLEWFDTAMEAGQGLTLLGPGETYDGRYGPAYLGVDLGVSQKEGSDLTAFWAMAVNLKTGRRVPLDAFEERIDGPTVISRLKDWHRRLSPSTRVENNAAQDFIRQRARQDGIATSAHTTGKNKADISTGVPSLGVELEQGMWVLPCGDERSQEMAIKWRTQCLAYAPGQHTGDLLMASWFSREQARMGEGTATVTATANRTSADYTQTRASYDGRRGLGLTRRGR